MQGLLAENVAFSQALAPASRAAANVSTGATYLSMQDFEFVTFTLNVGAITGTGLIDLAIVQATDAAGTASKAITSAALVQIADTGGSKLYGVTVRATQLDAAGGFYFVSATLTTTTAANVSSVVALRYGAGHTPVTSGLTQDVRVVI